MGSKHQLFQLLPWEGGVNTALDPSMIPENQLVQADNVVFATRGSRKKRDGINFNWDDQESSEGESIIAQHDFWFGAINRTQRRVALSSTKALYSYNSDGTRTTIEEDDENVTEWSSNITQGSFLTYNNKLLIAVDGSGNKVRQWDGSGKIIDLAGSPPEASFLREYLGRVWCNDKNDKDRLHYSTPGNEEEWGGVGDSGAIDIGIGDGDPEGITNAFVFKGVLFVAKRTKLYKILGDTPENFQVVLVSDGIGCVSPSYAAVDESDVVFISERGIHSLAATDTYGDFAAQYLSRDIQPTFNSFNFSRLKYIQVVYASHLNSLVFAVPEDDAIDSNNALWLYNIEFKAWYRWPNISCQSICLYRDGDKPRIYIGSNTGRLAKTENNTNYDIDEDGSNKAIIFRIKTGLIYPDKSPYLVKGFKRLSLVYSPQGTHTITCTFKIDNYEGQSLVFSQTGSVDLLGSTFVLGTSLLGYSSVSLPYTQPIDGYGRGFQLTIEQSGIQEDVEIQGLLVEYKSAGTQQEVLI